MAEADFDSFWKAYPARKGDRAKGPALLLFDKHVKSGIDPKLIIDAAKKFCAQESEKIGTEFIMQAQRWLRNRRWLDYVDEPSEALRASTVGAGWFIQEGSPQWVSWQDYTIRTKGKRTPVRNFGWWFPSEWPPHE